MVFARVPRVPNDSLSTRLNTPRTASLTPTIIPLIKYKVFLNPVLNNGDSRNLKKVFSRSAIPSPNTSKNKSPNTTAIRSITPKPTSNLPNNGNAFSAIAYCFSTRSCFLVACIASCSRCLEVFCN